VNDCPAVATTLFRWLISSSPENASSVMVPQGKGLMSDPIRVLILCTGNSARSQMAEGLLRHDGREAFVVDSAGLEPSFVRAEAIEVMREIGLDISNHRSKSIDEFIGRPFDYVITVCDNANQNCPMFPAATNRIHWSIEDPATVTGDEQTRLEAFRSARENLRERLSKFIEEIKKGVASH
jgi:arsenate reductase